MRRFDSRALGLLLLAAPIARAQAPNPDAAPAIEPQPPPELQPPPEPQLPPEPQRAPQPQRTPAAHRAPALPLAPEPAPAPATPAPRSAESVADVAPTPVPANAIPRLAAWLGVGSVWLPNEGLDVFAEDDALVMFSAGASVGLAGDDALAVAVVAGFDVTGSEASVRGDDSSLGLMRLALGPELRGSIAPRLFWHGRISPTLTRLSAELEDTSSVPLGDTHWVWGAEATAGLDFRFAEAATSLPAALGFFARVEGGYAWSPETALSLEPDGDDAPVRTQTLELGELALAGPVLRVSLGLGY